MTHAIDVSRRDPMTVPTDATVAHAAAMMRQFEQEALVVVDAERPRTPVGVLTDRDLVLAALSGDFDRVSEARVIEVAREARAVVGSHDEVNAVLALMRAVGARQLPVINGRNELVGLICHEDLLLQLLGQLELVERATIQEHARLLEQLRAREPAHPRSP